MIGSIFDFGIEVALVRESKRKKQVQKLFDILNRNKENLMLWILESPSKFNSKSCFSSPSTYFEFNDCLCILIRIIEQQQSSDEKNTTPDTSCVFRTKLPSWHLLSRETCSRIWTLKLSSCSVKIIYCLVEKRSEYEYSSGFQPS